MIWFNITRRVLQDNIYIAHDDHQDKHGDNGEVGCFPPCAAPHRLSPLLPMLLHHVCLLATVLYVLLHLLLVLITVLHFPPYIVQLLIVVLDVLIYLIRVTGLQIFRIFV